MITYEVSQRVARITLDRPEKRNALNPQLIQDLRQALTDAEADERVKVVVLAARGDSFCAGADLGHLQQLQQNTFEENKVDSQHLRLLFQQIIDLEKVVVAEVHGPALAGGCGLATVCDFVFAARTATFGYSEVKIGFVPALVMVFLIRKVGDQRARALLLGGQPVSAEEARVLGIVFRVTDPELLSAEVGLWVESMIQSNSAQAMARTKKMLRIVYDLPLNQALDYAVVQNAEARATRDCQQGIAAFLEKRKIMW